MSYLSRRRAALMAGGSGGDSFPFSVLSGKVVGDGSNWNHTDKSGWCVVQDVPVTAGHKYYVDIIGCRANGAKINVGYKNSLGTHISTTRLPYVSNTEGDPLNNYWEITAPSNGVVADFSVLESCLDRFMVYDATANTVVCSHGFKYEDVSYLYNKKRNLILEVQQPFTLIADVAPILNTTSSYGTITGANGQFQMAIRYDGAATNGSANVTNKYQTDVMASAKAVVENGTGKYYLNDEYLSTLDRSYSLTYINLMDDYYFYITCKMYGVKIYKNDVLIFDLVPKKRLYDNSFGLYDNVSGMFFRYRYTDDPTDINV